MARPLTDDEPLPGAFDPRNRDRDDLYGALARLRHHGGIVHSPQLQAWCVTEHDDIAAILRNDEDFSARDHKPRSLTDLPPDITQMLSTWSGESASLGEMDPPEHTRVRSVINAGFTPRAKGPALHPRP
ncbi:hypothetical protein [Streptomyces sp. NPDC005828]|uniref:hypothetical protein n=1 Tax=Streptomyces sp. NPDC005828 TaxID=3157071 RepID=UPI0033CCB30B